MTDHSQIYTNYNSYPSVMTPTEIDNYLKNLGQFLDWELQRFDEDYYFKLEEVYIEDIHYTADTPVNKRLVQKYAEMDLNYYPPIVVISNLIFDGHHRAAALKMNNQSTIYAYVLKSKLEYGEYV